MDFDYTTETITPDSTTILTIGATGCLELPSGSTAQQPVGAVAGGVRWNSTVPQLEYYNGTVWLSFQGSVTSVAVSGANGIGVAGSPITSSGTIALTLGAITPTSVAATGTVSGTTLTGSTYTQNGMLYVGAGGLLTSTTAATNGQILVGSTGSNPVLATLTGGTAISITNAAGSITVNNTGVTSAVSGTGINVSAATGAVTFTNTGVLSATGTANQVLVNATSGSAQTGALTLTLPQSIGTSSTPTFAQVTITNAPVNGTDAVNLTYLQAQLTGLEWKNVAVAATTTVLPAVTYANGTAGVGATLTASANGVLTIDGFTPALNDRVLIKNQASALQNGIYTVSTLGTAGVPFVLTRTTDADSSAKLNNATLYVTNGTTNGDTGWTQTTQNPTVGTNNITFVQFSGSGTYTAGTGLTLTGNTFSLTSPVVATLGGTGTTTAPTSGQVLVGTSGGAYVPFTITTGTGISTTTGSGTLQINNTGVTSFSAGTTGFTPNTPTTGAIVLSGVLALTNGGTNANLTAVNGGVVYSTAAAMAISAAGSSGQILTSGGAGAPTWTTLSTVAVTSITGTANQITASAATGAVTLSIPSTFIAPGSVQVTTSLQTSATNSITAAGTNQAGGTVLTTDYNVVTTTASGTGVVLPAGLAGRRVTVVNRGANALLVYPASGAAIDGLAANSPVSVPVNQSFEIDAISATQWYTVVPTFAAGTGITLTDTNGVVTITNAGVTTFSAGTTGFTPNTATSGAVTLAGVLALTNGGTNANLTAVNGGVVYSTGTAMAISVAGSSGQVLKSNGAAAPTWASNGGLQLYSENPSTPTAPSATGTNAIALGTGSAASGTNTLGVGLGSSAVNFGNLAFANGDFATAGDSQHIQAVLRNSTANNVATELFLDGSGASQRLVLPNNSAWNFTLKVVARRTDATGTLGCWTLTGLIYRDATAATTTLNGLSKTTTSRIGNIGPGNTNDPVVTADTTNGSLKVSVTGVTANTIRWVANVELVQVTN